MFRLTLKNLWSRKLRLITTSFAVLLGVAFVVGSLGLAATLNKVFDTTFNGVYARTDVVVQGPEKNVSTGDPGEGRQTIPYAEIDTVNKISGVGFASGTLNFNAQLVDANGDVVGGQGPPSVGQNWQPAQTGAFQISEGREPSADNEVVLDAGTAKQGNVKVGETVSIVVPGKPIEATIVGIAKFGDLDSAGGSNRLFFTFQRAQELAGANAGFNEIHIRAASGTSVDQLKKNVTAGLPSTYLVQTGDEAAKAEADSLKSALSFISIIPLTFGVIALLVSAFIINNTFSILLAQRSSEMALLRAIGARRRQVLWSVVLEAIVVGLIASLIGIAAGSGVAYGLMTLLRNFVADFPSTGFVFTSTMAIVGLVAGVGITLAAAFFPAFRSSHIPPLAALREVSVDRSAASKIRTILGVIFLVLGVAALIFGMTDTDNGSKIVGIGVALTLLAAYVLGPIYSKPLAFLLGWPAAKLRGVPGSIARDNTMRNPRRSASTSSALLIGVTLVAFCCVFSASLKATTGEIISKSIIGDFIISNKQSFAGGTMDAAVAAQLRTLPQLDGVTPVGSGSIKVGAFETSNLTTIEPKTIAPFLTVDYVQGSISYVDENGVAVDEKTAMANKWTYGQTINVQFQSGDPVPLKIDAIYKESNFLGSMAFDRTTVQKATGEANTFFVFANLKDGASASEAKTAVQNILKPYINLQVQDQTQLKDAFEKQINGLLSLVLALLALAIVIALFGIANTLALSVFERTREIGLLRAVGMTRRQTRVMIRWESITLSLLGTVMGLILGVAFSSALLTALRDDISVLSIPWLQLVVIAIVAIVAGFLAALLPARRAARLDVLKAISTN